MALQTNILSKLTDLIESYPNYLVEGVINKNLLAADARKYDVNLLNLLLKDPEVKRHFFTDTEGGLIFRKDIFLQFVSNKEYLPDSYTKYKIKIGLSEDEGRLLSESGDVVLNWPYKDAVLEGGQDKEGQKRNEVFFNNVLAPDQITRLLDKKVYTGWKRYGNKEEETLTELHDDDNLIMQGNNLVSLHSLKHKYANKIKMVYIDPPYNTGGDGFDYNDRFNHSTWLTFMKNRLDIAKQLMREDGSIFVSCDDNEQAYLKVLMDEVFGASNFITNFVVVRSEGGGLAKQVVKGHDYLLVYAKSVGSFKPLKKPKDIRGKRETVAGKDYWIEEDWLRKEFGKYGTLLYEDIESVKGLEKKKEIDDGLKSGAYKLIAKGDKHIVGRYRLIEKDGSKFYSVLKHLNADGKNELNELLGEELFSFPKPVSLLKEIIQGATFFTKNEGDIILDFFAGSGTTAQAVLELNKEDGGNRQFILCEQMNYVHEVTIPRITKIASDLGKDFVYAHIMNNSNKFRNRVEKSKVDKDYLVLLDEATTSSFLSYRVDPKKLNQEEFRKLSAAEKRRLLLELIDNNTLYVNYEDINDPVFGVSDKDKEFNKKLYEEK